VKFDQSKDIVARVTLPKEDVPYLRATLTYNNLFSKTNVKESVEGVRREDDKNIQIHKFRLLFVDRLRDVMKQAKSDKPTNTLNIVNQLVKDIESSLVKDDAFVVDLLKDLQGQTTEALEKDESYKRWGQHFLPSLMGAHLHQQCNNFKDFGVQHYAGKLFTQIRDEIDNTFLKIPPPVPSRKDAAPVNMSAYYNAGGGCIDGECLVLMDDGRLKLVKEVKKNDVVRSADGRAAKVVCVVETRFANGKAELVRMKGGLVATPYHPVRINGTWKFPIQIGKLEERACVSVYDFVLETGHVMLINGIECVTLGHEFEGEVIQHPYFGTKRVLEDLKNMSGWSEGAVILTAGESFVRNECTGLVCAVQEVES